MKVFIDTAPFIYLLEDHPDFSDKVANFFARSIGHQHELITSCITVLEFSVKPYRSKKLHVIEKFENLLDWLGIIPIPIDLQASKLAAKLRAENTFLKGLDSLQVALAIQQDAQEFLTNDNKLARISELEVKLVSMIKD